MDPHLPLLGLGGPLWLDPTVAASVFLFSLVLAAAVNKLVFRLVLRDTRWTPIRLPITLGIVVLGGYVALRAPLLDLSGGQQDAVDMVAGLFAIILGVVAVASVVSRVFDWYIENATAGIRQEFGVRLLPLFRRVASVLVYGLGALLVLDHLGVSISPLIAGLGLGGLAVALAIQPTLANLFAGTYVMTEGVISPGDYIELENGIKGYVVDVGWRSTRIRDWRNNLVVVPNSRFAETIITNYQKPIPAVNVIVYCGVSYDCDLFQVERVSNEVMDEVLDTNPGAVKDYGGWFGFDNFGDSNVNFWLFVQAKDRLATWSLQTSLMQRLHQRFEEEGIAINYPVRTLQFPKEWGPEWLQAGGVRPGVDKPQDVDVGPGGRKEREVPRTRGAKAGVGEDAGEGGEDGGPE